MTRGRLEAQITVPTGGHTIAVVGTASGNATVAAGTYYPTDYLSAWAAAVSAVTTDNNQFVASWGESGTGKISIVSSANLSVTWTNTNARDLLGYVAPLVSSTNHAAPRQFRGVWLPNAELASAYGNADEGHTETDAGSTESPRGDIKTLVYTTRQVLPWVRWSHTPKEFARISAETTLGASFEQWWRWTQGGELSYFETGSPFRLYWDAASVTYKTYRMATRKGTEMPRVVEGWNGLYDINLERLVRVPGT